MRYRCADARQWYDDDRVLGETHDLATASRLMAAIGTALVGNRWPLAYNTRARSSCGFSSYQDAKTPWRTPGTGTLCAGGPRGTGKRAAGSCTYSWTSSVYPSWRTLGICICLRIRWRTGTSSAHAPTSRSAVQLDRWTTWPAYGCDA